MRKLWRLLVITIGLSGAIHALSQTTPVPLPITGNLGAVSGTGQAYAGISIQLQNCPSPISITGYFGIVQTGYQIRASSSGLVTGSVWSNDLITCNGTTGNSQYNVTLMNNGTPSGTPQCYQVTSTQGAWNMNTQQPIPCTIPPPNPQDAQFRNLNVTGCFSVDGSGCNTIGTVTSVGMTVPSIITLSGSPITTSGVFALGLSTQSANQFFSGPCSAGGTPAFRFICTADFVAALAADSTFTIHAATVDATTINSTTINNSGVITTGDLISGGLLRFHTDCSTIGFVSFALNYISNGAYSGPVQSTVTSTGVCPTDSSYVLGPWVSTEVAIAEGGGLNFSNCGAFAFCAPGTGANQTLITSPTAPTGACPGASAGTNDPFWNLSESGSIDFCSNQTGSTWQHYSGGGSISLTTTGTSGAATLTGGVLNIPVYSGGGLSGSGTTGFMPIWTGTAALGNGPIDLGATTPNVLTMQAPTNDTIEVISSGTGGTSIVGGNTAELASLAGPVNIVGATAVNVNTGGSSNNMAFPSPGVVGTVGILEGSITAGHCPEIASDGVGLQDSGAACGGGGGGPTYSTPVTTGCVTSGNVTWTESSATYSKEVTMIPNNCVGGVTFTFPVAFTNAPSMFGPTSSANGNGTTCSFFDLTAVSTTSTSILFDTVGTQCGGSSPVTVIATGIYFIKGW